jgi:hypothetical protein
MTGGIGKNSQSHDQLAPTWPMLKMSSEDYKVHFDKILDGLDPRKVLSELPDGAVLLCWERPFDCCHRRRVAEWLEEACGIEVTELGYQRSQILKGSVS